MKRTKQVVLLLMFFSILFSLGLALCGPGGIAQSLRLVLEGSPLFFDLRLSRICFAFAVGGVLGLSGLLFQSFFHNPLASPYILGISSAAALGSAIYFAFDFQASWAGISGASIFALLAALFAVFLLLLASTRTSFRDSNVLLLFGFALGILFSSAVTLLEAFIAPEAVVRRSRWLLGSLDMANWNLAFWAGLAWLFLGMLSYLRRKELDWIALHEAIAYSKGVRIPRERAILLSASSLTVALVVSFAGPIGFLGILVPHICRAFAGFSHTHLIPACLFFGGAFLVASDTLARCIYAPYEIPVGAITALLGGLGFVWILLCRRG